jgi:NADPH2:quinone reductase
MRAWQAAELGPPGTVLRLTEVEPPTPARGQVVIEVEATGLGYPDVLIVQGAYQSQTSVPHIPGQEVAGRVVDVGSGVDRPAVGDRVVAMTSDGLAERTLAPVARAFPLPAAVSAPKAAGLIANYGTMWHALRERARLQAGEWLLVRGASGGVGSAAIQLGVASGATVIALAGGPERVERCKALGARHVIDHDAEPDVVGAVRDLTEGRGVDVCVDPVGGPTFKESQRCMAWGGRLLVVGFVAGIADAATNHILLKGYSVVGVHWGALLEREPGWLGPVMDQIFALCATGSVDPLVYPPYPFDEAAQALVDIAGRRTWGKVVVLGGGPTP